VTRTRRPSPQTVRVLHALAADPSAWRHGYELGQEVGLKAGSLYPMLMRLCDRGLLEASWEAEPPQGRPPRHLYRLTADGAQLAAAQADQAQQADQVRQAEQAQQAEQARRRPGSVDSPGPVRPRGELRGAW
jgi:PadR family transcriptional regulator PadR